MSYLILEDYQFVKIDFEDIYDAVQYLIKNVAGFDFKCVKLENDKYLVSIGSMSTTMYTDHYSFDKCMSDFREQYMKSYFLDDMLRHNVRLIKSVDCFNEEAKK